MGIAATQTMSGRVSEEGLRGGEAVRLNRTSGGVVLGIVNGYGLSARISTVNNSRYLDYTEVKRR
jgi:hypothetical protein